MADCVIAIVHSDPDVRISIAALLQSGGFEVRLFDSAESFLDNYREGDVTCVIAGIRLPEMDGLALQKELRLRKIPLPMIVITSEGDVSSAVIAMKAGAVDFLENPLEAEQLFASVRICHDQGLAKQKRISAARLIAPQVASLTPRERQVLERILAGDPSKVIAHDLDISTRTVEVHRMRVMAKMHARNLSDLVRIALSVGIGASETGSEAE